MVLSSGTRLGPYEILAPLGAGGMGEVYRARDTKLGREVAIKILPHHFTTDPERLVRFEREARVLASLNHPHVGAIYGLEDAGDIRALVLELVDGETLADRLSRGPLPLADARTIATQIAEALDAAHERGIVHRDLKPANIKITPTGVVKVLDFGLAKATGDGSNSEQSHLHTVTASGTNQGTILGTAAYMSPEQARGHAVDKRTDVWSFGCVLYEMLTGRRAFGGETFSDSIASILQRPPDWTALPAATPPSVRHVLARCLEKDLKKRWRDIGDVRLELEDRGDAPTLTATETQPSRSRIRALRAALILVTAAAAALVAFAVFSKPPAAAEVRFDLSLPRGTTFDFAQFSLSPDGQQMVVAPAFGGRPPLWLKPLDSTTGRFLRGTEGGYFPFWSPDSRSIGFFADQKLKRIDLDREAIEIVASDIATPRGASWQADGNILFAPSATGPLFRVPSTGGQLTAATHLEGGQHDHRSPVILPDDRHFIYYVRGTPQTRGVYVALLDGTESKRLLDADSAAVYANSGHLLFARQNDLFAQPFDASRLALSGAAFRIGGPVSVNPGLSLASLSASAAGHFAYGTATIVRTQFVWFDRSGKRLESVGEADKTALSNPALSPDGRQIAFNGAVGNSVVWLTDMRGALTRFTGETGSDSNAVWSFDGRGLVFQSQRGPTGSISTRPVAAGGIEEALIKGTTQELKYPTDVSADGRFVVYNRSTGPPFDIWYVPVAGDRTPRPLVETMFDERDAQFSPDAKWIAYQSAETGKAEIYVQPFPGPGGRIPVSTGGGQQVRWGRRGDELFYVAADRQLTSVPITIAANGALVLGKPVALFRTEFDTSLLPRQQYSVSPDGQRFLLNTPTEAIEPSSITMVLNWKPRPF